MRGKRNTPAVFSLRSSTAGVPLEAGTEPAEGDAVIHPADLGGAGVSAPPWTPARADHALRGEGGPAPSVGDRAALTAAPPCRRLWRYASPQGRSGPPPPPFRRPTTAAAAMGKRYVGPSLHCFPSSHPPTAASEAVAAAVAAEADSRWQRHRGGRSSPRGGAAPVVEGGLGGLGHHPSPQPPSDPLPTISRRLSARPPRSGVWAVNAVDPYPPSPRGRRGVFS